MRKLFRIIIAIPFWLFLQTIGTLGFTLFFVFPILGFIGGIGSLISYLGTGDKDDLQEAKCNFGLVVMTIFGGTLFCYSWIQTGRFSFDNYGVENKN